MFFEIALSLGLAPLARDSDSPNSECLHLLRRTLCALDWCRSPREKGSAQEQQAKRKSGRGSAVAAAPTLPPKPGLLPLGTMGTVTECLFSSSRRLTPSRQPLLCFASEHEIP